MLAHLNAPALAEALTANLSTSLPYHDPHFHREPGGHDPHLAHPAFGNSYDWHSSVNSTWAALRLRQLLPDSVSLDAVLATNLTAENIVTEREYFQANPTYERPYGWAWFLLVYAEADRELREILRPLAELLITRSSEFFSQLLAPITHGVHSNTAFAATLMADAAARINDDPLTDAARQLGSVIKQRVQDWFVGLSDWPADFERSGHDFLSPGLTISEAVAACLPPDEALDFIGAFLPGLDNRHVLAKPVDTRGSRDAQQVHWHGLNLSRAGQLWRIAGLMRAAGDSGHAARLREAADHLFAASLAEVTGDNYASTHWLPSFALRAIEFR